MKKRLISVLLSTALVAGMAGCGQMAQETGSAPKADTAVISSADAKDEVLKDPAAAADVFEFASDQLASLVDAGTLYRITTDRAAVEENNIENAVAACIGSD